MRQNSDFSKVPSSPRQFGIYIEGEMLPAKSGKRTVRYSPAHDCPVTEIAQAGIEDVDLAVASARQSFDNKVWSGKSGAERASVLLKAAALIRERQSEIAYWETLESGKPISQTNGEVAGCADMFEYASGLARTINGESYNNLGEQLFGIVTREPIGVVGLITPWNFPFLILCERVPYILAAGCTIVTKPSEYTSATTLILAEIFDGGGFAKRRYECCDGSWFNCWSSNM